MVSIESVVDEMFKSKKEKDRVSCYDAIHRLGNLYHCIYVDDCVNKLSYGGTSLCGYELRRLRL